MHLTAGALLWSCLLAPADPGPPHLTGEQAVDVACRAPEHWFIGQLAMDQLAPTARLDAVRGRWEVDFAYQGRRVLAVAVDDAGGGIVDHFIALGDRRDSDFAQVIDAVQSNPNLAAYLAARRAEGRAGAHRPPATDAHYDVAMRAWLVTLDLEGGATAQFVVQRGVVTRASGPWVRPATLEARLRRVWAFLRPDLSITGQAVAYLYSLAALFLFVDRRRLWSWRTLDALALALFGPAWVLFEVIPSAAYAMAYAVTVYLCARVIERGIRPGQPAPLPRAAPVYLAAVLILFAHHLLAPWGDVGPGHGGLLGGQAIFRDHQMPYGQLGRGLDTYGPLHYLIHGVAGLVFPIGVDWRTFNVGGDLNQMNTTALPILAFGFHLLTIGALVGFCRKYHLPWGTTLGIVAGYLLLAPSFNFMRTTSHRIAPALVLVGLWLWPGPWTSGLFLALGTAALWYPVFLFPLWLTSFRGWNVVKFAGTYVAVGAAFLALVLAMSPSAREGWERLKKSTLTVQEVTPGKTGVVLFAAGPWRELVKVWPGARLLQRGIMIVFLVACAALAMPFRKDVVRMVCLSAAVVIGTQLWKGRHGLQYLGWYAPLLMLALFAPLGRVSGEGHREPSGGESAC